MNIASRLQQIADAGGIYISESIDKVIRVVKDIHAIHLGEFQFKNVTDSVGTYALQGEGIPVPDSKNKKKLVKNNKSISKITFIISIILLLSGSLLIVKLFMGSTAASVDSIAVLPFDNLTGNAKHQSFVDGKHDALIGELGQISALRVISKTSTLKYKGAQLSIPETAKELGVDAIMEGSVFEVDKSVKIQVKLIKAFPEEKQLLISSINKNISNIYEIYLEASREIVNAIKVELTPLERDHLLNKKSVNPEA